MIAGGARGIGLEVSRALAEAGANVKMKRSTKHSYADYRRWP